MIIFSPHTEQESKQRLWMARLFQQDSSFKSRLAMFNNNAAQNFSVDPFQTEDPFKNDPFNKGAVMYRGNLTYYLQCECV